MRIIIPPKLYTRLFEAFCKPTLYQELQGDLEEEFNFNLKELGEKKAKAIYRKEVLKMIRPSIIKLKNPFRASFQASLFRVHLILSVRNLRRNKVFSAINILGLGAALSVCLFLVNMLYTGLSHDNQHPEGDRLYRITTTQHYSNRQPFPSASGPIELEETLLLGLPEIELSTVVEHGQGFAFPFGSESYRAYSILVDTVFFEMFNFKVIEGSPQSIFEDLNSIVITQEVAQKIFPNESALGKETLQGYVIKAVIETPKNKSHLDFQVIGNRAINSLSENKASTQNQKWSIAYGNYFYVRLNENISINQLDQKLERLSAEVNNQFKRDDTSLHFESQLVSEITFGDFHQFDFGYVIDRKLFHVILLLGVITLAIASFNYTNLSIARAIQRTKEVSIRKINGSTRAQIVGQFLIETVIFSLLAMGLALTGYFFFASTFNNVLEELSGIFTQSLNPSLIFWFLILSIGIGLFAGFLPALYFSRISPLKGINSRIKSQAPSVLRLRKLLTGFQLTISMLCVLTIALGNDLYKQVLSTDMGFDYEGLITFKTNEIDPELFKNELSKLPSIKAYTLTGFVPGVDHNEIQQVSIAQSLDTILTYKAFAHYDFGQVYNPRMISDGSPQSLPRTSDQILVNPLFLQRMNIPIDSALGRAVYFQSKNDMPAQTKYIGGVLNGFVRNALEQYRVPFIIELLEQHPKMNIITLSIASENLSSTLAEIENIYQKFSHNSAFEPKFVDDQIKNSYVEFLGIMKVIWFLGISIILISVLGQLGIALYNAESRVKEIGIRKVLGAAINQILRLLLRGTISALIISFVIAAPLAYLLVGNFIMPQIAIKAHISLMAIFQGFLILSIMVVGVILTQTWRTARLNPSESLKSE